MDSRGARRLASLSPAAWRGRYGDKFVAFLADHPMTLLAVLNVMVSAIHLDRPYVAAWGGFSGALVAAIACWHLSRLEAPG